MDTRKSLKSRALAVFLSIAMIFTVSPAAFMLSTGEASAASEDTGKITGTVLGYVYFGSYPQREVVSKESDSGVYGKTWATENDYIVDSALYQQLNAAIWDANDDTTIGDNKYHRMKESDATYATSGDIGYYNWSDESTYHYFKYEPIKWRVLEKDGDNAFLLAETALDDQEYNNSGNRCTWETSSVRSWLNNTFLNRAFTADEQVAINTTTVENKNNISFGAYGGNDTQDKVFLLSESEVYTDNAVKYGFDPSYSSYDKVRQAKSSTYAKAMGARASTDGSDLGNCYWWWLRSPGYITYYAALVHFDGYIGRDGYGVGDGTCGVRPALYLNLESDNLYTAEAREVEITSDDVKLASTSFEYDGTAKEPEVMVKGLKQGKDYSVSYSNNKNLGTAKVTITGTGTFSGTIKKTFTINLPVQTGTLTREVDYDLVEFGSYPQREVVYTPEASGVYGKTWATEDDYIVDADLFERLMAATWDANDDTTIGDNKYHRMKMSDATYARSGNSGHYNWSDESTYHYFKYEPIKWRVLDKDGDNAFLLAETALDGQQYSSSSYSSVTWEKNTIRSWLNGYGSTYNNYGTDYSTNNFINRAFTADEQAAINTTTVENKNNISYGTNGGNNTQDKVFLLSESEVLKYGFDPSYSSYDKARQAKSSTYAKAMGAYTEDTSSSYLGNCYWWLRSPGFYTYFAAYVNYYGYVGSSGYDVDYYLGVRPALYLNLESVDPESAGKTGVIKTMSISKADIPKDTLVYRNTAVTPKVSVAGLTEGKDYDVAYSNNNQPGIATITVTGKGNWTGTITRYFITADEIDISDMTLTLPATTYYYSGSPICPTVTIEGLEEGTDFDVSYEKNDKAGIAKVIATGKDGYTGSIEKSFRIYLCDNHSYGEWTVIKEATCTEKGSRERECSLCHNKITEEIPKLNHTYGEWTVIKEATCTEKGSREKECSLCHNKVTEEIPKKDHKLIRINAKAESCIEDGNNEYYQCNVCKKYFSDEAGNNQIEKDSWVIKAHHSWNSDFTVDIPATCIEKGSKSIHCKNCTETKDTEEIPKKDHKLIRINAKAESCTEDGNNEYYQCNECKKYFSDEAGNNQIEKDSWVIKAHHSWNSDFTVDIPATCTEKGSKSIHCKNCTETKDVTEITNLGHDYRHKTVKAQIGIAGKTYDECSRCHKVINQKTLKALNPAATKISSVKGAKKSFTVKWAKKSYTGYQIRYSLKSGMESAKAVTIAKASIVSKKVTKLKAKKKYYVQVRTYKTVNGKKWYSTWSAKKAVRTK